jgi:hypothetical protein
MLIDSHCPLDHTAEEEIGAVVRRAVEAGAGRMVTIGVRMSQAATVKRIAAAHPEVWGTIGIHPHNAGEGPLPTPEQIAAEADHPRIIGIGESGLDYFYDKAPRGSPACRWWCMRAMPMPTSSPSCAANATPAGPSTSCCTASAAAAIWRKRLWRWGDTSPSPAC